MHSVKVMTLPSGTFESFWEYPPRTFQKFWEDFNRCVHHSLSLESADTQLKFIDELKQTGDTLFPAKILVNFTGPQPQVILGEACTGHFSIIRHFSDSPSDMGSIHMYSAS
jgi:hypothetical protein